MRWLLTFVYSTVADCDVKRTNERTETPDARGEDKYTEEKKEARKYPSVIEIL